MIRAKRHSAFTLVELLVVIAVIGLLSTLVVPIMGTAVEGVYRVKCAKNLQGLGEAMGLYHSSNRDFFWPCRLVNKPRPGGITYYWGSVSDPVDPSASPFMKASKLYLSNLWCPKQQWGDYVPQGSVSEPTTTYGYNAWCLDPEAWGRRNAAGKRMGPKRKNDIKRPNELFVFADSAMYWAPGGVGVLQNSTHLEPVTGTPVQTPTTHFRHMGRANALTANGAVEAYQPGGWRFEGAYESLKLGFVGTKNEPHYDQ